MSTEPVPCPSCNAPVFVRANRSIIAHYAHNQRPCTANNTRYEPASCSHTRTVSVPWGASDTRHCRDCRRDISGREIAAAQVNARPPRDYATGTVEDRITAALTAGLEPGEVMADTAIRQALKSPTLRRIFGCANTTAR